MSDLDPINSLVYEKTVLHRTKDDIMNGLLSNGECWKSPGITISQWPEELFSVDIKFYLKVLRNTENVWGF